MSKISKNMHQTLLSVDKEVNKVNSMIDINVLTFVCVNFEFNSFKYSKSLQGIFSLNALFKHLEFSLTCTVFLKEYTLT